MSEKKGWGKTVLGWFVVQDGEADGETTASQGAATGEASDVDALIRKYGGGESSTQPSAVEPAAPAVPVPVTSVVATAPIAPGAAIDFAVVFEQAGVDAQERDRVTKAQELLRSLPAETPAPVKRQIVEASLRAFGVATEKIIEASVGEIEALEVFIRQGQADTQAVLTQGTQRITELEREIASVKQVMEGAVSEQNSRAAMANQEKLKIQQVLEFFGQEAVAKVVEGSPRLQSPPKA